MIIKKFGLQGYKDLLIRVQYMDLAHKEAFVKACLDYNTRPGASWSGGFFGHPFIPTEELHES